jgi:ribosomal protein S18 acetylase RimI-like enzyme
VRARTEWSGFGVHGQPGSAVAHEFGVVTEGLVPAEGPEVQGLLALAMFDPSPGNVERLIDEYRRRSARYLYAYRVDQAVVGVIGLAEPEIGDAEIIHIAVEEQAQRRGIGRAMIEGVIQRHGLSRLEAETDWGTGYFYRACGFRVWSIGTREYAGGEEVERLRCVWTHTDG